MSKIIFAHPFSAALYAYFSDQIGAERSHTRSVATHTYYRTLYGNGFRRHLELALTFLLLYDHVTVAPADNHWPKSKLSPDDGSHIVELGLHSDWRDFSSGDYGMRRAYIADLLNDSSVQSILRGRLRLPRRSWELVVEYALYEERISARTRTPILCSAGRRELIEALVRVQKPSLHPTFLLPHSTDFLEQHIRIVGLALAPRSFEQLFDAKPNEAVRKYGRAIVKAAHKWDADNRESRRAVALAALEAIETEAANNLFAGLLRWSGSILRFVHEPLFAGTAAGAAILVEKFGTTPNWCEFKGSIDKAISKGEAVRCFKAIVEDADR
jgi:hypothetical protein